MSKSELPSGYDVLTEHQGKLLKYVSLTLVALSVVVFGAEAYKIIESVFAGIWKSLNIN